MTTDCWHPKILPSVFNLQMEKVSFFMGLKFNTEFTYLLSGSLRFSVRIMDCILLSVNTYTRWVNKFLQLIVWFPETIKFGLFNIPIYSFQTINWRNLFTPLSPLNARTPELDGKDALIWHENRVSLFMVWIRILSNNLLRMKPFSRTGWECALRCHYFVL